jgi:hypothetical protein
MNAKDPNQKQNKKNRLVFFKGNVVTEAEAKTSASVENRTK